MRRDFTNKLGADTLRYVTALSDAIRDLRKTTGSHEKLAAALGTTRNTVMLWEKGAVPTKPDLVEALVSAGIPRELLDEAREQEQRPVPDLLEELAERVERVLRNQQTQMDGLVSIALQVGVEPAQLEQLKPQAAPRRRGRRS